MIYMYEITGSSNDLKLFYRAVT